MEIEGHAWEHGWDLVDTDNGVAQFPNYWVDTQGAFDLLITPAFNPTGHQTFSFDVAHQTYAAYVDGLEVWGRPGSDDTWTVLWSAYGSELAVDGCYTWFWYDTGGTVQWAHHAVALPQDWTNGTESCLELAFVNVGGYGNHTWVDNATLDASSAVDEATTSPRLQLFPNPNHGSCVVVVPEALLGQAYRVVDSRGRVVREGRFADTRQTWEGRMSAGMYTVVVEGVPPLRWVVQAP